MSVYREFTGKSVEEALKNAREAFGAGLDDLDFEILTPGSRGVLGMGAEPARIVAAPRAALGGSAPKREAASAQPLPAPPPREDRPRYGEGDRGPRRDDRPGGGGGRDRGPRRDDRGYNNRDRGPRPPYAADAPRADAVATPDDRPREDAPAAPRPPRADDRPPRRDGDRGYGGGSSAPRPDRGPRRDDRARRPAQSGLSASEAAEVAAARGSLAAERADLEAAEASPEALDAGRDILEQLMRHLGFDVRVEVETGDTSRLNVVGDGDEKDALGALIGRKGERLSALQHLVNLMLSRRMNGWTRVLVDVEDYRGRRERQLRDLALRAAGRVVETGKMLQLEPMPALERRWVHIALRENQDVVTQSIGEEPNRRIVVLPRQG
jgi:spoIIIJ-associated protein